MSGYGHDTETLRLTVDLPDGSTVRVRGDNDGVNGFTWTAEHRDEEIGVRVDHEVLIDGITPADDEDTILDKAQELARRLNAGELARDVLDDLGLEEGEDYYGEDMGSSGFGDVDDPSNNCVDLCWHDGTHYQVRRREHNRGEHFDQFPWEVEVMRRPGGPE